MAKKKHQLKLPKRVAGMKIPKVIRKGPIGAFLNSSAGQLVLAETLIAAAAAFTVAKADDSTPVGETLRHPVDRVRRISRALTSAGSDQGERLAHALRQASKAFREALHDDSDLPAAKLDDEDAPKAKKKSSGRADAGIH